MAISRDNIPLNKKLYAIYRDDMVEENINFIATYVINEAGEIFVGTKNDMVGTHNGYCNVMYLTGSNQINTRYLYNIHEKK